MSWKWHKDRRKITPHNESFGRLCSSATPSFQQNPETLSLILSNLLSTGAKHATILWQTFIVLCSKRNSLVQSTQLSGKLSRLKNKHVQKNVHASRLNTNGTILVVSICNFCKLHKSNSNIWNLYLLCLGMVEELAVVTYVKWHTLNHRLILQSQGNRYLILSLFHQSCENM